MCNYWFDEVLFNCDHGINYDAIILNVHDPFMNGIPNYSMDIHMQLWM